MWKVGLLGFVCAGVSFEGLDGNPDGVSSLRFHIMPHGSIFIIFNKKPLAAHQRSWCGMQTMFGNSDGLEVFLLLVGTGLTSTSL